MLAWMLDWKNRQKDEIHALLQELNGRHKPNTP